MEALTIIYGSETGNAEELAYSLHASLSSNGFPAIVYSTEEYNLMNLPTENMVVFIVSTTGEGDHPISMKSFWKFLLRKSLSSDALAHVEFTVFGLGDSSYEKFNVVARKLCARLKQLGARSLIDEAYGDDQARYAYYSAYVPWCRKLFTKLESKGLVKINRSPYLQPTDDYTIRTPGKDENCDVSIRKRILQAEVVCNSRITSPSWHQDVRHLVFRVQSNSNGSDFSYVPGDIAEIFYENDPALVERALNLFAPTYPFNADDPVVWQRHQACGNRPSRLNRVICSARVLLTKYLDIAAIPQRKFFEIMSNYCSEEEHKEKLLEISTAEGTDLYFDYCVKEKRNFIEVMEEFPLARPPLVKMLEVIPLLQARQYSIASSNLLYPSEVLRSYYIFIRLNRALNFVGPYLCRNCFL